MNKPTIKAVVASGDIKRPVPEPDRLIKLISPEPVLAYDMAMEPDHRPIGEIVRWRTPLEGGKGNQHWFRPNDAAIDVYWTAANLRAFADVLERLDGGWKPNEGGWVTFEPLPDHVPSADADAQLVKHNERMARRKGAT